MLCKPLWPGWPLSRMVTIAQLSTLVEAPGTLYYITLCSLLSEAAELFFDVKQ